MNTDDMRRGVIPGIIAGYIFLAYMGSGMQDMVGGMIGADAFIGFILHIIISVVIGALYTGVFMQYVKLGDPLVNIVVGGLIFGLIWWIIGGNIIMPRGLGWRCTAAFHWTQFLRPYHIWPLARFHCRAA